MMLSLPPLGFVQHLGKNQSGADWVQYFTAIQNLVGRRQSGDVSVGEKLSRPALSHNSRTKLIAPSSHRCHDDLRIFFLKQLRHPAKLAFALIALEAQLAVAIGRLGGFFPFSLPVLLRFGSRTVSCRRRANEPD